MIMLTDNGPVSMTCDEFLKHVEEMDKKNQNNDINNICKDNSERKTNKDIKDMTDEEIMNILKNDDKYPETKYYELYVDSLLQELVKRGYKVYDDE